MPVRPPQSFGPELPELLESALPLLLPPPLPLLPPAANASSAPASSPPPLLAPTPPDDVEVAEEEDPVEPSGSEPPGLPKPPLVLPLLLQRAAHAARATMATRCTVEFRVCLTEMDRYAGLTKRCLPARSINPL
jgi:hypothetical protein